MNPQMANRMNEKEAFQRCLQLAGDHFDPPMAPRAALAEICSLSRKAPYKWTRIPPEHCITLEEAFDGQITRYEMRPDVFGADPAGQEAA